MTRVLIHGAVEGKSELIDQGSYSAVPAKGDTIVVKDAVWLVISRQFNKDEVSLNCVPKYANSEIIDDEPVV